VKNTEEPKTGVYVCYCRSSITSSIEVQQIVDFAKGLDSVIALLVMTLIFESAIELTNV